MQLIDNRWFGIINLLLVIVSGVIWLLIPEFGLWTTLFALLPNGLRMLGGHSLVKRTPLDWLILIFLVTALMGYWAAYDKASAWIKLGLIITSILLYYSLCTQPKQNIGVLSFASFCLAIGVSIFFFLANDFTSSNGWIALWWMQHRPQVNLPDIHHGNISGLLVITIIVASYWLWEVRKWAFSRLNTALKLVIVIAMVLIGWAFIQTMSRGIWAAIISGAGVWLIWKFSRSNLLIGKQRLDSLFPLFTLIYLGALIAFIYLGPAKVGGDVSQSDYGLNTRAEVQGRSTYFLNDYPLTGGGLNSFPGLYSQYMIVIPFFFFLNSYNLFLDIGIEQGIIGGMVFVLLYLASIWRVSWVINTPSSSRVGFISWLGLLTLIVTAVHGLFYDYLYQGGFTILLFYPVGFSMIGVLNINEYNRKKFQILELKDVRRAVYLLLLSIAILIFININKIISIGYANLGAVQMSQVELKNFPTNQWTGSGIIPDLEPAENSLHTALQYDITNPSSNFRLGMISMLRQDYKSAVFYLEEAYLQIPNHRGIVKTLGYAYAWSGDMERAHIFLAQIPEAKQELDVYAWWWTTQGRSDLARNASLVLKELRTDTLQH